MVSKGKRSLVWCTLAVVALVAIGGCKRNTAEYGGKTERPAGVPTQGTQLDPNVPAAPTEAASGMGAQ